MPAKVYLPMGQTPFQPTTPHHCSSAPQPPPATTKTAKGTVSPCPQFIPSTGAAASCDKTIYLVQLNLTRSSRHSLPTTNYIQQTQRTAIDLGEATKKRPRHIQTRHIKSSRTREEGKDGDIQPSVPCSPDKHLKTPGAKSVHLGRAWYGVVKPPLIATQREHKTTKQTTESVVVVPKAAPAPYTMREYRRRRGDRLERSQSIRPPLLLASRPTNTSSDPLLKHDFGGL